MNEITGTSGDDSLSGSLADETIKGSGGEDTITGGDGNDVIYGGYGGTLNLGTLSYSFGGEYVDDDYQINSLEIPNTVQSGDRFWVVIHDHVYTKAIQLEVHDLGGGDFSLQVVDAKYDTETVFSSIDGDFQAIQDHFNSSGNWMPTVESLSGYGYGLHNISVDGVSYSGFLSTTSPTTFSRPDDAADSIDGGLGNDTIYGELGNDTIDGGGGDDLINGGVGDDLMTGGSGDDTFELASPGTEAGHNTITDFNTGNSGAIDDGDQSNNDLVDLSAYYNETTLAAWNAANPTQQYANPIAWMRADQNDDGVLNASEAGWTGSSSLSLQNSGSAVSGDDLTFDNTNVLCFDRGTFIETKDGPMVVEELRPGILVRTLSNGFQPLRLVLKKRLNKKALARNEKLRPVRICKGALATNVPNRDLCVSRQHRILAKSAICNRMFGIQDALIAGIKLTNLPRIFVDYEVDTVEYHHLVFDNHEVIFANGAAAESFYPGPKALKALTPEAYEEITTLFPFLMQPDRHCETAALIPDNKRQKTLVERHLKNRKPLQEMLESVAF